MTRIGPSGRLNELLRIVGTRPTDKNQSGKSAPKKQADNTDFKSVESLRKELATEISAIDLNDTAGRETAKRLLIHKIILARFEKIQPNAAQLSFLTREVSQKAATRPEVRELLDAVIDEIAIDD